MRIAAAEASQAVVMRERASEKHMKDCARGARNLTPNPFPWWEGESDYWGLPGSVGITDADCIVAYAGIERSQTQ